MDVDMKHFAIQNRAKLLKYILHTKHRRPEEKMAKLTDQFSAEKFKEIMQKAQAFFGSYE
jgi:hypothetical protein